MPLSAALCLALAAGMIAPLAAQENAAQSQIDKDLFEVTVPQLEVMYAAHKYTVRQVVEWHLARIHRYNGIYKAVETVMEKQALAQADVEDAQPETQWHELLWGVPIVLKANTSIAGEVTTDGWAGYTIPGHELVAPKDAPIVARLRAAGAILIGHTNMPDFAASDTNRSSSFGRTGNAYDVRYSPGGSSGGTVTAVTSNMAVLGNGTDTGNSIRMPAATSAVVGLFPTRGMVPIAGIAPLDWLLDNTGPIARDVTDVAIALTVISGMDADGKPTPDAGDARTVDVAKKAQAGPYTQYLKRGSLKGKRFGVPAFILHGTDVPFQGLASVIPEDVAEQTELKTTTPLEPETKAAFLKAIEGLREAGAEIVFDEGILPDSFAKAASRIGTLPYVREGTEEFLREYGPAQYHSAEEYARVTGKKIPATVMGSDVAPDGQGLDKRGLTAETQAKIESDPRAQANYFGPRKRTMDAYLATMEKYHLDGYVYPATQMPPPDETMPQGGEISGGPHSETSWVNMIGVPAIVVSGGFYPGGLPFGLEISTRPWHDGDLLGWAYDYEQTTHHRHPPVLVESGLLPNAP